MDKREQVFLDDARWPGTTLVESDEQALVALRSGKTVWSAMYGAFDDEATDEDGNPLFTTLDDDDLDTLESFEDGEGSGWGPFRIETDR